jgi:hypothetical protein
MPDDGYPDDVDECPDWCIGDANKENQYGAHLTDWTTIDDLSDGQRAAVRGVRGWYEGTPDYVIIRVQGHDGRKTELWFEQHEWTVVRDVTDNIMYQIT